MIAIYHPVNLFEAQCLKDLLNHHHIFCHLAGADLTGAIGELPAIGLLALQVDDQDAGLARQLIEEYQSAIPTMSETMSDEP